MRPAQKMKWLNNAIAKESESFPLTLKRLPESLIAERMPHLDPQKKPFEVWRSRGFMCQVYRAPGGERLSFNRTQYVSEGRFSDAITWDELQRLKAECGRGDKLAVEIYPADKDVVNVANMRHLFVIDALQDLPFVWKNK